jgi:GNAT superfamily N-acetyltransferase
VYGTRAAASSRTGAAVLPRRGGRRGCGRGPGRRGRRRRGAGTSRGRRPRRGVQDVLRDPAGECGGEGCLEGAGRGVGLQPYGGGGRSVVGGVGGFDGDADQDGPGAQAYAPSGCPALAQSPRREFAGGPVEGRVPPSRLVPGGLGVLVPASVRDRRCVVGVRIGSFQQAGPPGFHRFPRGSVPIMADWEIRPASAADVDAIAELRAVVLRGDLERLGRYDARRVRQRLRDGFVAEWTWVIEVGGAFAGCVALRPDGDARCHWLEHFYLAARHQGGGIGSGVLGELLERCDRDGGRWRGRRRTAECVAGESGSAVVRAVRVRRRGRGRGGCVHGAGAGRLTCASVLRPDIRGGCVVVRV